LTGARDLALAGAWFEACGLPEGAVVRAMHFTSVGAHDAARAWEARAVAKGHGAPWRVAAREATGSGGAGGVDLNCQWPPNPAGQKPPRW
jgi:hypothetical protein